MVLCGIQKLSLLDYPQKLCATVFTGGCNFRCPFCQNPDLVLPERAPQALDTEELIGFMEKRRGKLDGLCITGGEPLLQSGIGDFIRKVRAMGFLIKLDTNGSFPNRLQSLVTEGLLDYIAMDIKNSPEKYPLTAGVANLPVENILRSASFIMSSGVEYEFRTTVVREFHTEDDFLEISRWLRGAKRYYLQSFVDTGDLIGSGLHGYSPSELHTFCDLLAPFFTETGVRGV